MTSYDYIIVGAGISGCCTAYEIAKYSDNILIADKLTNSALGASGAAGAFLSPLLGKPNQFKDLVTKSLIYSTNFYKQNFPDLINCCGTTRIPQDSDDEEKFQSYIPFMDFEYEKDNDGYFFKIGSVVDSFAMCQAMLDSCKKQVKTQFNFEITKLSYEDENWIVNDSIRAKNIIITTGSQIDLFDEFYLKMRAVWGMRIDISTSSSFEHNYHKACSVSISKKIDDKLNFVSVGATHHREESGVEDIQSNVDNLLTKANDIAKLEDVTVLNHYKGARACSVDYFPMVGEIIDSNKTLEEFPYMVNGTNVENSRFTRYNNAYMLTGVGGRGFVLAPYLAKQLVENIVNKQIIESSITVDRLFKREVKRIK
ncbi:MAG: FAD-dependent oxidoreductase [Arcobacteraceae bacterium]